MTVIKLVDRYIATRTGVRHTTLNNYRFAQNTLANEGFGKRKIKYITISDE